MALKKAEESTNPPKTFRLFIAHYASIIPLFSRYFPSFPAKSRLFVGFFISFLWLKHDDAWTKLRDETIQAILNAYPGCTKKDKKPFQPHATVANRDIPVGIMTKALQVMNELNLAEDFPVDNITIFERKGNRWEAGVILELNGASC